MTRFRYKAVEVNGSSSDGFIDAENRKDALKLLGGQGLFPSLLEMDASKSKDSKSQGSTSGSQKQQSIFRLGSGIKSKEITVFTQEMAALLEAGISIPQAMVAMKEEIDNPVLKEVVNSLWESVHKGVALSAAMESHPQHFSSLYVSMIRVGEEAGALHQVMQDVADLLEHEDDVRSEVVSAVAYPMFVLGFGVFTVVLLLTVVLPRLFGMLNEMMDVLPLPTLVLLKVSGFVQDYWWLILIALGAASYGLVLFSKSPQGRLKIDGWKLKLPLLGPVFSSSATSRFARTLGTLARAGVSLLPSLKIVEFTIGNKVLANSIAQVAEETRKGDSLAGPLGKAGLFPKTAIQMIHVGEETGKLDTMLLKVADMEEKQMRARTKTLVSLLAPLLILVVGALVGFIVIALLLPIFKMSQTIH
ncbi:type II secretion system F family protein [bacterium]|nr:type II secretion system F family protein [bacterium]